MQKKTLSRTYLIAMFAVFFAPLFFAMWLFFGANTWLSKNTQNHGELIQPLKPLNEFSMRSIAGTTWQEENFLGKWTLLYLGDEYCDLYCEASLFKMRQVRLTLGRERQRVQRKYLGIHTHKNSKLVRAILTRYPDMQVDWFEAKQIDTALPPLRDIEKHQIYVIDPLGNLMMFYNKDATSKGMKKDLKRLLKVSKVG